MDKFSKQKLTSQATEIVNNAHMGDLTDKDLEISINVRQKRGKLPQHLMVFQAFAYLSATKLRPATNKVLMYFFASSGYENYVGIDQKTIMEKLSLSKPTVVLALKELDENNIIKKFPNPIDHRRHDYFINPLSAWKGNSFTRKKMIQKITKEDPDQLSMFSGDIHEDADLYKALGQLPPPK